MLHRAFSAYAVQVHAAVANGIDAALRVVVAETVLLFSGAQACQRVKFSQLFVDGGLKGNSLLFLVRAKQFNFVHGFGALAGLQQIGGKVAAREGFL